MPKNDRLILIPPSEGKALGGEYDPWTTDPSDATAPLREGLRKMFGVKGDALTRTVDANSSLDDAPTLPAIERYEGVLYQHLDAPSLGKRARRTLDSQVRILSGLWGFVTPSELIPDYRLKMSTSLPGLGKLSTWWREVVTEALVAERRPDCEVWNLLPQEHAAAWDPPTRTHELTAVFLQPGKDGALKPVAHWNKALKGSLVAHLVSNPAVEPGDLTEWEHPDGYLLDESSLTPAGDGPRQLRFVQH